MKLVNFKLLDKDIRYQEELPPLGTATMFDNGIMKIPTDCCALCQLSMKDDISLKEVQKILSKLTNEADSKDWADRTGGQRAAFTIVTPYEQKLEQTLIKAGFKETFQFKRRKGYVQNGNLKMYMYNW